MLKNVFWFLICCYLAIGLLGVLGGFGFGVYLLISRS